MAFHYSLLKTITKQLIMYEFKVRNHVASLDIAATHFTNLDFRILDKLVWEATNLQILNPRMSFPLYFYYSCSTDLTYQSF